ncbi:MAG: AAA family ATPase [Elusimicrobiales bacterium]|nr:AAA family ATPase [Elusimicrobiales bacterium]
MPFNENWNKHPFALGESEFTAIIDGKSYYCDKTLLIKDLLDSKTKVMLFTRPRRFGKTLNMTMLRTFFEKALDGKDTSHYFQNLKIWQAGEEYRAEQGKRPVIYLTFKDIKQTDFQKSFDAITKEIAKEYRRHNELSGSRSLNEYENALYKNIFMEQAPEKDWGNSIAVLSSMLFKHHGTQPVILIDEYDVPIQAGFEYGFYNEIISFMRNFLSSAFKDNPSLYKGALTGVTRVSKESIFSGLNNLKVDTIFDKTFSTYFGFTQEEINEMFKFYAIEDKLKEAEEWYDGYIFGNEHIYNPWSIINYLDEGCKPGNYWVNMSENGLAGEAMRQLDKEDRESLAKLMTGEKTRSFAATHVIYNELGNDISQAYGLLAQTGYLRASNADIEGYNYLCTMEIPNRELFSAYSLEVVERMLKPQEKRYASEIIKAVIDGNAADLQKNLTKFLMETCSYLTLTEEKDYQNILIALLASMKRGYDITLEKESGLGRADIILQPRIDNWDKRVLPGIIIELKHCEAAESDKNKPEKIKAALEKQADEALQQIETKGYIAKMRSAGVKTVIKYGVAASGKQVCVKTVLQ